MELLVRNIRKKNFCATFSQNFFDVKCSQLFAHFFDEKTRASDYLVRFRRFFCSKKKKFIFDVPGPEFEHFENGYASTMAPKKGAK